MPVLVLDAFKKALDAFKKALTLGYLGLSFKGLDITTFQNNHDFRRTRTTVTEEGDGKRVVHMLALVLTWSLDLAPLERVRRDDDRRKSQSVLSTPVPMTGRDI